MQSIWDVTWSSESASKQSIVYDGNRYDFDM